MTGIYLTPLLEDLSIPVQNDGFTCGSWMVAAAEAITMGLENGVQLKDIRKALAALAAVMKERHEENLRKSGR